VIASERQRPSTQLLTREPLRSGPSVPWSESDLNPMRVISHDGIIPFVKPRLSNGHWTERPHASWERTSVSAPQRLGRSTLIARTSSTP